MIKEGIGKMHILLLAWLFQKNTKNNTWKQLPKYYPNILYVNHV